MLSVFSVLFGPLLSSYDSMIRSWVPVSSSEVSTNRKDSESERVIYTLKSLVYLTLIARVFPIGLERSAEICGTVILTFYPYATSYLDSNSGYR